MKCNICNISFHKKCTSLTDEQYENMIVLFETNDEDLGEFLGFDLEFDALFNFSNESDTTFLGFDLDMENAF